MDDEDGVKGRREKERGVCKGREKTTHDGTNEEGQGDG